MGSVIFRYFGWSYKSTCVAPGTTNSSFGSAAFAYASSEKYFDTAFSHTMKSIGRGDIVSICAKGKKFIIGARLV